MAHRKAMRGAAARLDSNTDIKRIKGPYSVTEADGVADVYYARCASHIGCPCRYKAKVDVRGESLTISAKGGTLDVSKFARVFFCNISVAARAWVTMGKMLS